MLEALVIWAAGQGAGTPGTDLFVGTIPADQAGHLFRHTGGERDPDTAGQLKRVSFQVTTRAATYQDAYMRASQLADRLTVRQLALPGAHVYGCDPRHEPYPLGREESGAWVFAVNYDAAWRSA